MAPRALHLLRLLAAATIFMVGTDLRPEEPAAPDASPASPAMPAPGSPAPTFTARKLDGKTLSLESLRGRVVLLNFWAPACPPCRIEMPELEKIHRRHAGRGLRVIGVTEMDPSREQVLGALKEAGVTYPILLDPGARIGSLYAITAHPTSVLVDARGLVSYVNVGYLRGEEKDIEQAVLRALGRHGAHSDSTRPIDAREGGP